MAAAHREGRQLVLLKRFIAFDIYALLDYALAASGGSRRGKDVVAQVEFLVPLLQAAVGRGACRRRGVVGR